MCSYRAVHHLLSQRLVDDAEPLPVVEEQPQTSVSESTAVDENQGSVFSDTAYSFQNAVRSEVRVVHGSIERDPSTLLDRIVRFLRLSSLRPFWIPGKVGPAAKPKFFLPGLILHSPPRRLLSRGAYQSFPPPVFTSNGQPRALDGRLYPEVLTEENSYLAEEDGEYWSQRPHLWAEIITGSESEHNSQWSTSSGGVDEEDQESVFQNAENLVGEEHDGQSDLAAQNTPALVVPPFLTVRIRGGGLPDDQTLPSRRWWLAGGRGPPPTAGAYRAWRERERARIREENEKRGCKDRKTRGFFRELWWVLGGAKHNNYRRNKAKADAAVAEAAGEADEDAAGDAA